MARPSPPQEWESFADSGPPLMYGGHLAFGLALKAREPRVPTWAVLLGVGLLDLLFGPCVLLGGRAGWACAVQSGGKAGR